MCPSSLRTPVGKILNFPYISTAMTNEELQDYGHKLIGQIELLMQTQARDYENCDKWLKEQGVKGK